MQSYQLKQDKKLEEYKARLGNKSYISRARFDAEFKIYEDLSEAFSEAVMDCNTLFPQGLDYYSTDQQVQQEYDLTKYNRAVDAYNKAQQMLYAKAPLIPEEMEKEFEDIRNRCFLVQRLFHDSHYVRGLREELIEKHNDEGFDEARKLQEKYHQLINTIRDYLNSLDVMEK